MKLFHEDWMGIGNYSCTMVTELAEAKGRWGEMPRFIAFRYFQHESDAKFYSGGRFFSNATHDEETSIYMKKFPMSTSRRQIGISCYNIPVALYH